MAPSSVGVTYLTSSKCITRQGIKRLPTLSTLVKRGIVQKVGRTEYRLILAAR